MIEPEDVIRQLIRGGVKPKLVWAACRTGRLVTRDMYAKLDEDEKNEWDAALREYEEKYPQDDWDMRDISSVILPEKF
ncbi:hypothetical protein JXO59_11105 [candidate division KSB1 bacterium]|nr:hypothetical protein [candidate division KSB1 bacterium]